MSLIYIYTKQNVLLYENYIPVVVHCHHDNFHAICMAHKQKNIWMS
jgi:hypothetical protein